MLSSMQHIAHGSDSNLYFQWRKSRGSSEKFHGAVVDHDNSDKNRVFKDVKNVGKSLEKIQEIQGSSKISKVAIIYDWDNNWTLNDSQGYAKKTKKYPQTLQQHYRFFWNHDIPVDVISPHDNFSTYDLIIAPMLYLISENTLEKLSEYVFNGGNLVSTYISGVVDEHDLTYTNGWPEQFQNIFGINIHETDVYYPKDKNSIVFNNNKHFEVIDYAALIEVENAESIAFYEKDFYAESVAVTKNKYGEGEGYFIGPRTDIDFLEEFYTMICDKLSIFNKFVVTGQKDVSIQSRKIENEEYIFVMNFSEETQTIEVNDRTIDILSDESINFEINLEPYDVKVLKISNP